MTWGLGNSITEITKRFAAALENVSEKEDINRAW